MSTSTLPAPSVFGLPFTSWRPRQAETIEQALAAPTRIVVVQAPTGVGKTAIALGLAQLSGLRTIILTATKGLQDQYLREANDLVTDIRGANNYECLAAQDQFKEQFPSRKIVGCDEGPCLVGWQCDRRRPDGCLYFDQQKVAIRSTLTLTSYAYWLSSHRYAEGLGKRDLLILDEAHDAPEQLAGQMEVTASSAMLGVPLPATEDLRAWRVWATNLMPEAQQRSEDSAIARDRLHWKRQLQTLTMISGMASDQWVVEFKSRSHAKAILAPILVAPYVESLLFCKAGKVVLLSATVTPHTLRRLGVAPADVTWITLPSPFPVERRPVTVVADAGRIDHRLDEAGRAWWMQRMADIIEPRLDRKGIIHTVSYARQQELSNALRVIPGLHLFVPASAKALRDALAAFRRAGPGAVFISPSVVTGFDFPGDSAEYQIIAKVPFPDTRSPIMKARLKADKSLRQTIALQALIQAAGRIVRSVEDQGETFVTDEHCIWFLRQTKSALPDWFLKAVRITDQLPAPLPKLRST